MSYKNQSLFINDILNLSDNLSYKKQKNFASVDLLKIYQNNYFGSLQEALAITYDIIQKFVGEDFFEYLAKEYIQNYPLKTPDLINFGDKFYKLIKKNAQCKPYPYLIDLAKIQWHIEKIYNTKYCNELDINILQKMDKQQYPNMNISMSKDTAVIISKYAIFDLYDFDGEDDIDTNVPQSVLIKRTNNEIVVVQIEKTIALFYKKMKKGKSISKAIKELPKDFDFEIALGFLIQNNCIEKFKGKNK